MLVTCEEMSGAERRLFATGVEAEPYMDEAGRRCAEAILDFFPEPATAEVFCGKGNNGGDALVVALHLKEHGWRVALHFAGNAESLPELPAKKLAQYEAAPERAASRVSDRLVLIDGLLGIGAKGDLRGTFLELAERINGLRRDAFATCFAIDIPSGLHADTGVPGEGAVMADYTLSITAAKTGFAADGAINHVGRLVEIPLAIPVAIPVAGGDASRNFLFPSNLRPRLRRRLFDTHKGTAGRVTILAGSRGLAGAAVLTALGASRSGAGLVTVCVPGSLYAIVASQCPAEVMVKPLDGYREIADLPGDVWAIGPGLGTEIPPEILDLIYHDARPAVVDADALNALARDRARLPSLPANRLLTPHPGEMNRLTGGTIFPDRTSLARAMVEAWGVTLLFKGARTLIASPGSPVEFNTTGHPGMASGGMGDVLTGVTASLIARGISLHDAACLGSWLLGRAAEIAVQRGEIAPESVSAPLVAEHLGAALLALETPDSP
jgi:NAD(P)H-hydrate epimerase